MRSAYDANRSRPRRLSGCGSRPREQYNRISDFQVKEPPMKDAGAFELHVEPETAAHPLKVSMWLSTADRGMVRLSPDCMSLDELEGVINRLQDELDTLRVRARVAFASAIGHA